MITQLAGWVMLSCGGLFSGAMLFVAVERVDLWRRMSIEQYTVDFRRSLDRLDPLVPILGLITVSGAVVFALTSSGAPTALAWAAVALIVAIMAASVALAEPMNSQFRRLPEGQAPDDAERLRVRWRQLHWARTVAALGALACLAAAAA